MRKIELFILIILEILPLFSEKIHEGAIKGDIELIKSELAKGVNINLQDKDGRPVIMYAINNDQIRTVKYLLENGADLPPESRSRYNVSDTWQKGGLSWAGNDSHRNRSSPSCERLSYC